MFVEYLVKHDTETRSRHRNNNSIFNPNRPARLQIKRYLFFVLFFFFLRRDRKCLFTEHQLKQCSRERYKCHIHLIIPIVNRTKTCDRNRTESSARQSCSRVVNRTVGDLIEFYEGVAGGRLKKPSDTEHCTRGFLPVSQIATSHSERRRNIDITWYTLNS